MNQPQWQLAKILKKDNVYSDVRNKLIWVLAKEPQEHFPRNSSTLAVSFSKRRMHDVNIVDPFTLHNSGVFVENVELYPVFAFTVDTFDSYRIWLGTDNKTIFEMAQLTEELTYEDFERVFSH